jgi:hypothetical protein
MEGFTSTSAAGAALRKGTAPDHLAARPFCCCGASYLFGPTRTSRAGYLPPMARVGNYPHGARFLLVAAGLPMHSAKVAGSVIGALA